MALYRSCNKGGDLFLGLALVAWKPHPLPNDGPTYLLFFHIGVLNHQARSLSDGFG
jgi:hypothetical protein